MLFWHFREIVGGKTCWCLQDKPVFSGGLCTCVAITRVGFKITVCHSTFFPDQFLHLSGQFPTVSDQIFMPKGMSPPPGTPSRQLSVFLFEHCSCVQKTTRIAIIWVTVAL